MHLKALSVASFIAALLIMSAPTARAACDISQTKCALKRGKCSIQFRSIVEAESLPRNDTKLIQASSRILVRVKAVSEDGETAGLPMAILPGAKRTMYFETKTRLGFDKIRISSPLIKAISGTPMSCEEVKAVLNGNGRCNIFHGYPPGGRQSQDYQLGYQCNGGKVSGPS